MFEYKWLFCYFFVVGIRQREYGGGGKSSTLSLDLAKVVIVFCFSTEDIL